MLHKVFKDFLTKTQVRRVFHLNSGRKEQPLYLVAYFQDRQYSYGKYWVIEVFAEIEKAKQAIINARRNDFETHIWKVGDEIPFKYTKDKVVWKK